MARGSFGGGGGGRGFGGGGRSFGGGGKSSFSSSNFSSYKRSGGASPSSGGGSFKNNGGLGSFIAGAIIGSIFESKTNNNPPPARNQVFPEMGGQTLPTGQPVQPVKAKEPKYREYMACDYCNAEYNDLKATKCANCGAALKHKRVLLTDENTSAQNTAVVKPAKKKNTGVIVFVCVLTVIVVGIILMAVFMSSGDRSVMYSSYTPSSHLDAEVDMNEQIYGQYYNIVATEYLELYDLTRWGIEEQGYFVAVKVTITNTKSYSYDLNVFDICLLDDDENTIYACADMSDASQNSSQLLIFGGRSSSSNLEIEGYETVTGYLIFPCDYIGDDYYLDVREYNYGSEVAGYLIELD